jgi:hypothetical protein
MPFYMLLEGTEKNLSRSNIKIIPLFQNVKYFPQLPWHTI